jgi:hypothetical protein
MTRNDRWLALILVIVGAASLWWLSGSAPIGTRATTAADPAVAKLGSVWVGQTANYQVTSYATVEQTSQVGSAAEALLRAYLQFFALDDKAVPKGGLKLTLYKNQQQFKARNQAPPWAEAYYKAPVCYAYFDASAANPYHWMLHEATHQLNNEVAHLQKFKWIDEGIASYFGASRVEDFVLTPGVIEKRAYPVWWLPQLGLSGDASKDFAAGKLVPLRALISGQGGPDLNKSFNAWYIGYWSLTHFLLHAQNGRYAPAYRKLIAEGGSLENFERLIGPVDEIQGQWYRYLQGLAEGGADPGQIIVVD